VYLITPLHSTLTSTLMTLVTPSLVFSKVSIVYTSILILQTSMLTTLVLTSTTLLDTRVPALMTQVSSIAHMFLSRWFVPSVRTPSNQKLASRPVMVLSPTHLQKEPSKVLEDSSSTATVTTEESRSQTSCDSFHNSSEHGVRKDPFLLSK